MRDPLWTEISPGIKCIYNGAYFLIYNEISIKRATKHAIRPKVEFNRDCKKVSWKVSSKKKLIYYIAKWLDLTSADK